MEWMVPVNEMLRENINKLNYTLIPAGFHGDVRSVRVMQDSLSKLIDALGEQSAAAQGLNKVITTAEKLRNSPTHTLYLLTDPKSNGGNGEVIGLLKVGRKHLFLFDSRDQVREVEPLCVLDFFVQRDRQRHGYGRLLFDHMLKDMETSPHELAIDGPSPKMEQFLAKNYGVEQLMHQNNNFAVAPQFFQYADEELSKSGRSTPAVTPAVGRFAAPKPASAIANVIHGGGSYYRDNTNGTASGAASPSAPPMPPGDEPAAPEPPAPEPEPVLEAVAPAAVAAAAAAAAAADEHKSPSRPSSLRVEPAGGAGGAVGAGDAGGAAEPSPAGSTISRRDSQLTDRGFFDVKFYHNKLW